MVRVSTLLAAVQRMLAGVFLALLPALAYAQDVPNIAAASDLKFALEEIADVFRRGTGRDVKLTFGSSGNFFQQIAQGAPFQMFLSADEDFIFKLATQNRTPDRGALYAIGRIVLFTPHGSPLKADAEMRDLKAAVSEGRLRRFAIANPEHAPYGRAAEQALKARGLWESVKPALVMGENVSQAAQFATSGSAQGGIFAYSLALVPEISKLGSFVLIPAEWHQPLRQRMTLVGNAGPTAKAFFQYVQEPAARRIFQRYGFVLPGEG